MKTDKLAEEILDKWHKKDNTLELWITKKHALQAMQEYHQSKMAEVTNEDIEEYFSEFELANCSIAFGQGLSDIAISSAVIGAKAMRDGDIKHT